MVIHHPLFDRLVLLAMEFLMLSSVDLFQLDLLILKQNECL